MFKQITRITRLLLVLAVLPLNAQIKTNTVLEKVRATNDYIKSIRGYLHQHPEVSGKEYETTVFLQNEIAKLGIPVTKVKGTGFYAVIDTKKPGKTVALRADIDALPIEENPHNLLQPKKWLSQNPGVSHACGHDGHMAILLGAAKILNDLKSQLNGKIILVFEEGEETASGIDNMVTALQPLHIDAFYGNHLKSNIPTGHIFVREGAIMAGTATIAFDVIGKGGHASRPDLAVNPMFAAANILTGLAIAWNNQRDVTQTVTLAITQIQGSSVYNVIPNKAYVGGTFRFFDIGEANKCMQLIQQVSENIAQAHQCSVQFHDNYGILLEPVINDAKLTQLAAEAIQQLYPKQVVADDQYIWFAAETFSKYAKLAPAVFTFVGTQNQSVGIGAEHHNDQFDLDDEALQYGVGSMVQFAVRFLKQ